MLRYIFIFWLAVASQLPVAAQQLDSLRSVLPSLTDTARIDCLNELGYQYTLHSVEDSAIYFTNLAYEEASRVNYTNGIASSIAGKAGIAKHFQNDFLKTEELVRQALRWFERTPNKKNFDITLGHLIFSLFAQSRFAEALRYTNELYLWHQRKNNEAGMFEAIGYAGAIYREKGDYIKGFDCAQQSLQFSQRVNDPSAIKGSLLAIGQLYALIGDYSTALSYYRNGLQTLTYEDSLYQSKFESDVWAQMEYAELYSFLQQYDSASYRYSLFDSAKAEEKNLRVYLVSKGEYYLLTGNYENALNNFQQALLIHRKLGDRNQVMRTLINI